VLQKAIAAYDLVIAVGGGYLCDADRPMLLQVLEHLEAAIAQSVPTVMVGQGVGPLEDPELRARASAVLPFVDLIFVRERRIASALLASLGVPAHRVVMTGDDAIEMAFTARPEAHAMGIGVSLRVTPYTALGNDHMPVIRAAVQQAARTYHSELIALPISSAPHESDIKHIRRLMPGYAPSYISRRRLGTPSDTIRQTARCRVVVTGTFHGAVFALAQGIPVVALARSTEYVDKLTGLADEFGAGCRVVRLEGPGLGGRLGAAIDNAWASADAVRAELLENAARLVGLRQAAYQRLKALGPQHQGPPGPYLPQPPGRRGTDELYRL
jgi:colanic acid/amylovoran biosynthesis protein